MKRITRWFALAALFAAACAEDAGDQTSAAAPGSDGLTSELTRVRRPRRPTAGSGGSVAQAGAPAAGSGGSSARAGAPAAGSGGAGQPATSSNGQWVLGYYVGYQLDDYPIASIDWSALTHIAFAPLLVNADGSLDLGFYDSHGTGTQDAQALSAAAHAHGVKAMLMLGGAGAGVNIAAAAQSAKRAAFVSRLLSTLDSLGYDGLDLDWEDSVNLDDLVGLAQALRAARPSIVLSYPAGTINGNYQTVDGRYATLAISLDRFNVQTYYPGTAFAGSGWSSWFTSPLHGVTSSTPIAIDDTLNRYAQAGIPKSKLGMGVAFYAICYTGGISGPRQPTNGTTQTIVGGDNNFPLSKLFASGGSLDVAATSERHIDDVAKVPYLSYATARTTAGCENNAVRYISYEDEASLVEKGSFSKANGYGGIIVWTIQEGYLPAAASGGRARNALMQALKQGFIDP